MTDPLPDSSYAAVTAMLDAARTRHAAAVARYGTVAAELGPDAAAPIVDALASFGQALGALSLIMVTSHEWEDDQPADDIRQAIALEFARPARAPRPAPLPSGHPADTVLAILAATRPVGDGTALQVTIWEQPCGPCEGTGGVRAEVAGASGRMACPFCQGERVVPSPAGEALLAFLGRQRAR